jgi:formate/nitrite transporter FocA (FNT family)
VVVLGRQQLFTESTLTAVLPVLTRRDVRTFLAAARLWGIVLAANLIGTYLFALLIAIPGLYPAEVVASLTEIAQETVAESFSITLVKAVFAGCLIALMVWLLPSAHSAKILVIMLLTYVVALGRVSHIIAGSVEAAFAVITGHASAGQYVGSFLLPTLIGNIIGGVSLVAFLNHAPVRAELDHLGE